MLDTETKRKYRRNNYRKTQGYERRSWTLKEIDMVLAHEIPDRELSAKIHRSVQSIQLMRYRMKKE